MSFQSPFLAGMGQGAAGVNKMFVTHAQIQQIHYQNMLRQAQAQAMPQIQALRQQQQQIMAYKLAHPASMMSGAAGQIGELEDIRQKYGVNSRQYQELHRSIQAQQNAQIQRAFYHERLGGSIGTRVSTALQKSQVAHSLGKLNYPISTIQNLNDSEKAYLVANGITFQHYQASHPQHIPAAPLPSPPFQGAPPPVQSAAAPPQTPPQQMPQGLQMQSEQGLQTGAQSQLSQLSQQQPPQPESPPSQLSMLGRQPLTQEVAQPQTSQQEALSPDQMARVKKLSQIQTGQTQSAIDVKTMTLDQRNRLGAANRTIPIIDMLDKEVVNATKYSGMVGGSKLMIAKLKQQNDPGYLAYTKFEADIGGLKPEAALAMGVPATNEAMGSYGKLFELNKWSHTPAQALALYQNFKQLLTLESQRNTMNIEGQREAVQKRADEIAVVKKRADELTSGWKSSGDDGGRADIHVRGPSGQIHSIPSDQLQAALAAGGQRIG